MCELYNRLLALCNKKGVTGAQMCRGCGVSKSLMSDLKYGRRDNISTETAVKIANYFEITVEEVLTGVKKEPIPKDELVSEIIDLFSQLRTDEQGKVLAYVQGLLANRVE